MKNSHLSGKFLAVFLALCLASGLLSVSALGIGVGMMLFSDENDGLSVNQGGGYNYDVSGDSPITVTIHGDIRDSNGASGLQIDGNNGPAFQVNVEGNVESYEKRGLDVGFTGGGSGNYADLDGEGTTHQKAAVNVSGDVSGWDGIRIHSYAGDDYTVNVEGNVKTAESGSGIDVVNVDGTVKATVGKDVADTAIGIDVHSNTGNTSVDVTGGVYASTAGVRIGHVDEMVHFNPHMFYPLPNVGTAVISVGDNESGSERNGIKVEGEDGIGIWILNAGEAAVDVAGAVTARTGIDILMSSVKTRPSDEAQGEEPAQEEEQPEFNESHTTVRVYGNVAADETGLKVTTAQSGDVSFYADRFTPLPDEGLRKAHADVLIDGTLSGIYPVVLGEEVSGENLSLTVWKIETIEDGETMPFAGTWRFADGKFTKSTNDPDPFDSSINYIIRVEQPEEKGAQLSVTNEQGNSLETVKNGNDTVEVAKEGETIYLVVSEGFEITAAYNQGNKKIPKDDNGNWYIKVPKGGGILLSADVKKKTFTVTFLNSDEVLQSGSWEYGEKPEYDEEKYGKPIRDSTAQYTFTWSGGWDSELVPVTKAADYHAVFSEELKEYEVTFDLNGGSATGAEGGTVTVKLKYGSEITPPDVSYDGKKLDHWEAENGDALQGDDTVSGQLKYTAIWADDFSEDNNETKDDGTKDDGTKDDGTKDDGTKDDGTKDDGTKDDGTKDDGTKDDGTKDDGTKDDGTKDDGTKDDGTKDDGTKDNDNKKNEQDKPGDKQDEDGNNPNEHGKPIDPNEHGEPDNSTPGGGLGFPPGSGSGDGTSMKTQDADNRLFIRGTKADRSAIIAFVDEVLTVKTPEEGEAFFGVLDLGEIFAEAVESEFDVPIPMPGAQVGHRYTVTFDDGNTAEAFCPTYGVVTVIFPKDAKGVAFTVKDTSTEEELFAFTYKPHIDAYRQYGELADLSTLSPETQARIRAYVDGQVG